MFNSNSFLKSTPRTASLVMATLLTTLFTGCVSSTSTNTPPPQTGDTAAADGSANDVGSSDVSQGTDITSETKQDIEQDVPATKKDILVMMQAGFGMDPWSKSDANLRIVNLTTHTTLRNFELGKRKIDEMAIDYAKGVAYLAESSDGKITVLSLADGSFVKNFTFKGVRGLSLSKNGKKLYAIGYEDSSSLQGSLKLFNTETGTLDGTLQGAVNDQVYGLKISDDEKTAAYVAFDGSKPFLRTIDLTSFQELARTPILNSGSCSTMVSKIAFTDNGRIILSDGNCDAIYQYDIASKKLLSSLQIDFPNRDSGSAMNPVLAYSSSAKIGIATKEDINPSAPDMQYGLYWFNPATLISSLVSEVTFSSAGASTSAAGYPTSSTLLSDTKLLVNWRTLSNMGNAPQEVRTLNLSTLTWESTAAYLVEDNTRSVVSMSVGQE